MSTLFIEEFLAKRFLQVPKEVRVGTYISLLVLFIYLTLLPRFIYGDCVADAKDGGEIPCFGQHVYLTVDAQTIVQRTDEHGVWAFPVVSALPTSVEIKFSDGDTRFPIAVSWGTVVTRSRPKVKYVPDRPIRFNLVEARTELGQLATVFQATLVQMIRSSFAAGEPTTANVVDTVKRLVAQTSGKDTKDVQLKSSLDSLGFTKVTEWKLISRLREEFKVTISVEQWDRVRTVEDIVALIEKRLPR